MALGKNVIKGGLAAMMVMVMTAGAYAWSAAATTSVNVRSGPGTQFRAVDVLQRNQVVEVEYCRGSWCFVTQRSHAPSGWVSQSYLRDVSYSRPTPRPPQWNPRPPRPPHYSPRPPRPPYWDDYRPRPPHYNPRPPRPPHYQPRPPRGDSQVCFDGPNGYVCFGN